MQILASSGCTIEENIGYAGNDMTFIEVETLQDCADFALQDEEKGTMATLGWVFFPDNGQCRPQKTLVGNSNSQAVSGTLDCGKGKFMFLGRSLNVFIGPGDLHCRLCSESMQHSQQLH